MRNYFIVFLNIFVSSFILAQQRVVTDFQMPIYPGCEKYKSNEDRLNCFQNQVTSIYTKQLEKYINAFEYLNIPEGEAKVILELNDKGDFILKAVESNNSLFKGYCELAFEGVKKEIKKKRINIVPARTLNGEENLALIVSFPVGFKLNNFVEETKDRLISVLNDESTEYNVFITPDKELKVYESNPIKPIYLGKYNSIQEFKNTLPYNNLVEEDLITLVQSDFGKVKILLKVLNIFKEDEFYTLFIVSEVKGKKVKQLRKYTSFIEFKNSPYYDWLINN